MPHTPWLRFYDPHVPHHIDYPLIPLHHILTTAAQEAGDHPCTNFFGRKTSYAEIHEAARRFAWGLQQWGLKPGDRVGLLLPNMPQFIIAYYGILMAGGVATPLNPLYTENELSFQVSDAGARLLVTIPLFLEKAVRLIESTPLEGVITAGLSQALPFPKNWAMGLKEFFQARGVDRAHVRTFAQMSAHAPPSSWRPHHPDPEDLAVLIYSGGTTGVAKGIMLSHYALVANAYQIQAWGQLTPEDSILAVLPLFHGFGMSVTMNASLLAGGEIILLPRFNRREVLQAIQTHRPTFMVGVPTMFVAFNHMPDIENYDLTSLKAIYVGAAPLTEAIKTAFEAKTGARMIEGYGLTEAVTAIMANPQNGTHKIGSIGIPFPDVVAKIVDVITGEDLPPGEQGEIVLQSPTLMLGYWRRPEATAKAIRDGWLFTGDIGYMDEDGYFYITDRKKDIIIVGGFNVFPREIEEILYQHPKVREGVAIGVPDEFHGERIKLFVVLKEGETATEEEIIAYLQERLVPYKVPSQVEFRTELPKSAIGKILRKALRNEIKLDANKR